MAYVPKTNREFWESKFEENVNRDKRKHCELRKLDWHVIVVWECETKRLGVLEKRLVREIPSK